MHVIKYVVKMSKKLFSDKQNLIINDNFLKKYMRTYFLRESCNVLKLYNIKWLSLTQEKTLKYK